MTISMYQASVPVFSNVLKNLAHVLRKADTDAAHRKIDPSVFLQARLAPDMLTLTKQVQIATDHAKGAAARLAGVEILKIADTESSFAELQTRIETVRSHLASFQPSDIDGTEERQIVIRIAGADMPMAGMPYLLHYSMPNFYFHVTTAYAILRHNGVALGKGDFLGRG